MIERCAYAPPIPPEFHERFWARVNIGQQDECWTWKGKLLSNGYAQFGWSKQRTSAHRASYRIATGAIPAGMEIDHACWNRSCVNPAHLRLATGSQNMQNWQAPNSKNKSGVRGVCWHKGKQAWMAYSKVNYKNHYLGYFDTREDAEAAVVAFRREYHPFSQRDQSSKAGGLEDALRKRSGKPEIYPDRKANKGSASGHRGVVWNKLKSKWTAQATIRGKRHFAGHFDSVEDAAVAVQELRNRLYTTNYFASPRAQVELQDAFDGQLGIKP